MNFLLYIFIVGVLQTPILNAAVLSNSQPETEIKKDSTSFKAQDAHRLAAAPCEIIEDEPQVPEEIRRILQPIADELKELTRFRIPSNPFNAPPVEKRPLDEQALRLIIPGMNRYNLYVGSILKSLQNQRARALFVDQVLRLRIPPQMSKNSHRLRCPQSLRFLSPNSPYLWIRFYRLYLPKYIHKHILKL